MPWAFLLFLKWEEGGRGFLASLSRRILQEGGGWMDSITSRQNKIVREAAALSSSGEERRKRREFLCEGARLCQDAARSGVKVLRCFFTEEAQRKYVPYLEQILAVSGESYQVANHVAQLLSSTKHSQGVFCQCSWPETLGGSEKTVSRCVVLENLQDPGNLGTILRTAEALGFRQVYLLGDCCDPLSPKALRASMGAVFRVGLTVGPSREKLCAQLKREGRVLLAAVPDSAALPVTKVDFSQGKWAVFIGNEGSGLTSETIALCHDLLTIPMAGRAESLNASAAATILLWEMARAGGKEGFHG